jgi:hypothetical protein
MLCDASSEELKQEAAWTAAMHGQIRWQEAYNLSEILREIALLRSIMIPHLVEFHERHPEFTGARSMFSMSVTHGFLDDTMRSSVEQFLAMQERFEKP